MNNDHISSALERAIARLLRPLARLLLANGVTLQTAVEMLKQAMVKSAEEDFPLEKKGQTDSRISLVTGVHRKDVKRLRAMKSARKEAPPNISLGARLVSAWITMPGFVDADDNPLPLARLRSQGGEQSFEALAEKVSKDIRPRPLLDELKRLGAIHLGDNDQVRLNTDAFIPSASADERLYYLGRAVGDHLEAASRNVSGAMPPYLDRIVHYDSIPAHAIDGLRQAAEKTGMQALKNLNHKAMEAQQEDGDEQTQRITFGIYFFTEASDTKTENPT